MANQLERIEPREFTGRAYFLFAVLILLTCVGGAVALLVYLI
jgi:hypothetical protein